jgi:hypothetical protein
MRPGSRASLRAGGYTPNSAALQLGLMAHLSRWLGENDLVPERLSTAGVERFLSARRAAGYPNHTSARGLEPLLGYLRGLGVVPLAQEPVLSAAELLLARYRDYLTVERGLAAGTARGYLDLVRSFVASRVGESGDRSCRVDAERRARLRVGGVPAAAAPVGEADGDRAALAAWVSARRGADRPSARAGRAVGRVLAAE